jgi:hypothetical protein
LTGVDQGSRTLARVAEYRSCIPSPPGRVEKKKISRPSRRRFGCPSFAVGLFTPVSASGVPWGVAAGDDGIWVAVRAHDA